MKRQILKLEDFDDFKPEILFASDSERGVKLIGIWESDLNGISFTYEVRVAGRISRHNGISGAIRVYNEI